MARTPGGYSQQVRIIGGRWRGRRLRFASLEDLRPTPDRIRETLFNWLTPLIAGSRCLDLFAGSGALGIEALSRGAAEVVFVEAHPAAIAQIRDNLVRLDAEGWRVERADALTWLKRNQPLPFDVVFLDPPFGQDLLAPVCKALEIGWLAPGAYVYLEAERTLSALQLPENWTIVRKKTAGQVGYRLALRQPAAAQSQ